MRLLDSPTMAWEEGEVLNQAAPSAYSLAVHPQYGWTFTGVTDYVTFGEVQVRTTTGELLATVPVGISPGTLVWSSEAVDEDAGLNCPNMAYDGDFDGAVGTSDLLGLLTEFGNVCD